MRLRALAFRYDFGLLVLSAALSSALGVAGCGSVPTLPLPPPAALVAGAPTMQGLVLVQGEVNEDAYVTVMNENTRKGAIEQADEGGHFEIEIAAKVGDRLTVWQARDGLEGERAELYVPAPAE